MVFLLVVLTVILLLVADYMLHRREAPDLAREPRYAKAPRREPAPDEVAPGAFVGPGHAWLRLEKSGLVTLGADRLAPLVLGDPNQVFVRAARSEVRRGEPLVELRSRDRSLHLAAPVDGTIVEVNRKVTADPSRVASDPFGEGWLVKLAPSNLGAQIKSLFVGEEAVAWMRQELRRLRDTLALLSGWTTGVEGATRLADGGLPMRGLADALSPDDWEKLQRKFFHVETA